MATEINRFRGTTGELWQTESFDHLVRDFDHFRKFQKYMRENPEQAGLAEGAYLLYDAGV
jgi:menaquinone-specific isochorismate synthase